ncbi:MAG: SulP family inorganic anion transporter [Casimicrobiaceae bacterium]
MTVSPRLFLELRTYNLEKFRADLLAGLTVGIIAVPLAMAFAIASGVSPEQGLVTAVIAGVVIGALGGTRLCVAGPTGAFIVVLYGILARYGWANLVICTIMAGAMLIAMGLLRLGGLIKFVPNSVVIGFTNGIAVLIAISQVKDLLGLPIERMPGEFFGIVKTLWSYLPQTHWPSLALTAACFTFLKLWPARWSERVPGPFLVLVLATLPVMFLDTGIATIGSRFGEIHAGWPAPSIPKVTPEQLGSLIAPAMTIALLAAIESLLCAVVADKQTRDRHDPNTELVAQGAANILSPLFGGLAITSAIARTSANIRNGAKTPVASIVHALTILAVLLIAAPLARHVPLPALAAILLWVAFNMGEWHAFRTMGRFKPMRNLILLATFALTVLFDLTVAVEVGLLLATVLLIKRLTEAARFEFVQDLAREPDAPALTLPAHSLGVRLRGALFFGVADRIREALTVPPETRVIVLDLLEVIYIDSTALETLIEACTDLQQANCSVLVYGLGAQARSLFDRSGLTEQKGEANLVATKRLAVERARALLAQASAEGNA